MKFTGWYGPKVLYFGDHVYSDLMVSTIRSNLSTFWFAQGTPVSSLRLKGSGLRKMRPCIAVVVITPV